MLKLRKPAVWLTGLSLSLVTLAGCGMDNRMLTDRNPKVQALGIADRTQVQIQFRDRDQLEALSQAGVDLFENVDMTAKTVDATLTPQTEATVKRMGVRYTVSKKLNAMGMPSGYSTVSDVMTDLQNVASQHAKIAHLETIGKSVEGRPIVAIRLTSQPEAKLPAILITSGQHARELPPVQLTSRFIHLLTDGYGSDTSITKLVDSRDIWIVPIVNPDGRVSVEGGDSMWRKNRRDNGDGSRGVDTNRNADDHWSQGDRDSQSDSFRGSAPFSEPESQALRDLAAKVKFNIAIDFHNYAGMILWPPSYTNAVSKDEAAFREIGNHFAQSTGYKAGTIANTIYKCYGDFATWAYSNYGTLAYGIELDDGRFNPAISQADKDWKAWKDNLLWAVDKTGHPLNRNVTADPTKVFPSL
ncbi:MAG TPA: M14 family metallopeptidase [Stenomitos sp.]